MRAPTGKKMELIHLRGFFSAHLYLIVIAAASGRVRPPDAEEIE
jgi:hypothetical protein